MKASGTTALKCTLGVLACMHVHNHVATAYPEPATYTNRNGDVLIAGTDQVIKSGQKHTIIPLEPVTPLPGVVPGEPEPEDAGFWEGVMEDEVSARMMGVEEATSAEGMRFVVSLIGADYDETLSTKAFCSGTLIHPRWVLTSRQCLSGWEYKLNPTYGEEKSGFRMQLDTQLTQGKTTWLYAAAGGLYDDNVFNRRERPSTLDINQWEASMVSAAFQPWQEDDQFDVWEHNPDVMLLKLQNPLPNIPPVILSKGELGLETFVEGTRAYSNRTAYRIAGFGAKNSTSVTTGALQVGYMQAVKMDDCIRAHKSYRAVNRTGNICAGKYPYNFCKADIGGPLLSLDGQIQLGISSWNRNCGGTSAATSNPGVFERVSVHYNWIVKTMNTSSKGQDTLQPVSNKICKAAPGSTLAPCTCQRRGCYAGADNGCAYTPRPATLSSAKNAPWVDEMSYCTGGPSLWPLGS